MLRGLAATKMRYANMYNWIILIIFAASIPLDAYSAFIAGHFEQGGKHITTVQRSLSALLDKDIVTSNT